VLGFSQGGAAMALDVASGRPLAGLIALQGGLSPTPLGPTRPAGPGVLTHGEQDPVVPVAASEEVLRPVALQRAQRRKLLRFSGGHTIDVGLFSVLRTFPEGTIAVSGRSGLKQASQA